MSDPIREELQRFTNRFLFYGRTILIGMSITAIFFCLYAGLRANYLMIQIITVLISTLSVALAGLFFYFALRTQKVSNKDKGSEVNEDLIRQLILDVQGMRARPNREQVEGGLFRLTFLLAYRFAYIFYSTLQLLRFDFPGIKPEKKA